MEKNNQYTQPNGASYLLKAVRDEGISHVFMVPGFKVEPFMSHFDTAGLTPIIACQEGGAAYMADGYSRASQNFGVALGIAGPGTANMVNAISAAYSDRSPVLVIAGNSKGSLEGLGSFQDATATGIDDRDLFLPMTVFTEVIPDETLVGSFMRKAIKAMLGFENRPALISMSRELQTTAMEYDYQPVTVVESPRILDADAAGKALDCLLNATHITILAGNGAVRSEATQAIQAFAEKYHIPVVTSARAKGVISEENEMSMGVFGLSGSLWANQAVMGDADGGVPKADVLLVLGCTLNESNTHGWLPDFVPNDAIVRVDINPNNILGKEYEQHFVTGDVLAYIQWLDQQLTAANGDRLMSSLSARKARLDTIRKTSYWELPEDRTSDAVPIKPQRVIAQLREAAPRDSVMVVDSGAHTYFSFHHWTSYGPNEFLMLSTTGPMGYGIATTIGAYMARPDRPHITLCGDGSMFMHGIEISVAARYKVPMVIVVINNCALGAVYYRTLSESPEATKLATLPRRNWADFAKSLGGDGVVVTDPNDLAAAFEQAFSTTDKPFVVDVHCDPDVPEPNTKEAAI